MNTVVGIDGPAGSGKSSVARRSASELGFQFLDTGAAYRSLAWLTMERGADPANREHVLAVLDGFDYDITLESGSQRVLVNGRDVTGDIRTEQVSRAASQVAVIPEVRRTVNEIFRRLIKTAEPGIVVEGRDITTVVAPDADVRILLTASEVVRAERRAAELGESAEEILRRMRERDTRDRGNSDFLEPAEGVVLVDSSDLNLPQTVQAVVNLVRGRTPKQ
ncbi:MAG TPA: (d)CMP kinase [Candidatus Agrococcus pullicola]|uniref:Cytidylate kinase n=1 Tax=Candidatus Agrococcus pullicola TaxID=2838429 RepID=A0A9D1YT73_9MICO|nr:(d)CMP kinase [Candidatus Agrococcus pullicola]